MHKCSSVVETECPTLKTSHTGLGVNSLMSPNQCNFIISPGINVHVV